MNGTVIFLAKGTKVHPRLRGNNLVTKYGLGQYGLTVLSEKQVNYVEDIISKRDTANLGMSRRR